MGALTAAKTVPVEEYLSNPSYEHCEYIDGQVVELNVGSKQHSKIAIKCGRKLDEYFDQHSGGYVASEPHCRLQIAGQTRFRLPDVAVILGPDDERESYLNRAPDLVVEIRSPDDTVTSLLKKMNDYFASGAKLGWIILPEEAAVLVLSPDGPPKTVTADQTLDGGDLLPGLQIPVADLFR